MFTCLMIKGMPRAVIKDQIFGEGDDMIWIYADDAQRYWYTVVNGVPGLSTVYFVVCFLFYCLVPVGD